MSTLKLGQAVEYVGTQGRIKLAIIVGTPETIEEGTSMPTLNAEHYHLMVFTLKGVSARASVPSQSSVEDNDNYKNEDGNYVGVVRPVAA